MKERGARWPRRFLDAQVARTIGLVVVLACLMVTLSLAWGPRGLALALVLQAMLLVRCAPWPWRSL
jgi:hypothetical protein